MIGMSPAEKQSLLVALRKLRRSERARQHAKPRAARPNTAERNWRHWQNHRHQRAGVVGGDDAEEQLPTRKPGERAAAYKPGPW